MNHHESFSDSIYEEQTHLAENELSSFVAVVAMSYGPEQAELATEDWLDESDLIDSPPRSVARDWHAVTIAALARLAYRVDAQAASAVAQDTWSECHMSVTEERYPSPSATRLS